MSIRQRVAIVAPFFGHDLQGRNERFSFALATHLALEHVAVEVLTTTARPQTPESSSYRAGIDASEAFPVIRFRVTAPDAAARGAAELAVVRDAAALATRGDALLDESLRAPELLAHVRAAAERYDAFIFIDALAATTVRGIADVADKALVLSLMRDAPVARLAAVAEAMASARLVLCTTDAEAAMVVERYGAALRSRVRVVGLAADTIPYDADAVAQRAPDGHVLLCGAGATLAAEFAAAGGPATLDLAHVPERERAAAFLAARALAVSDPGAGVVPELAEAWAYGVPVLAGAATPGAAGPVRETGAGIVVADGASWSAALARIDAPTRASLARAGRAYSAAEGGWRGVALRVSEAVDAIAAVDDGRRRDALLAHVAYLYPLVQRQHRVVEAMRASRFWRLRDLWFAGKRRFGIGPPTDPIPVLEVEERGKALAALGDPYQLYRDRHRLRDEDVERVLATIPHLPRAVRFAVVIDARGGADAGLRATLRSLREQLWPHWEARVLLDAAQGESPAARLATLADEDARIVAAGDDRFGAAEFVCGASAGDRLEPHALFECALRLQGDDADVVYTDEDTIDARGLIAEPRFKPSWSPETLLGRDYVGALCVLRRTLVDAVGGVRDGLESARWYDVLLRVTEMTERVERVPGVLYHRADRNAVQPREAAIAVEAALRRRGEAATVTPRADGVEVRFTVPGDERVTIVIPTRDRADLLVRCIDSLFARSTYRAFDVIVVDNGSREAATADLLARYQREHGERFRVIIDPEPFNYSRINNAAVAQTDAPFVVLMNNDTEVITPDWIEAMLGQARRARVGAVGALLLYEDETIQHGGVILGVLGLAGHAFRYLPANSPGYGGALRYDTNYIAVTAAVLMIERRKYQEMGGLDESLVVAFNDVDFCLRLIAAGYRNVEVPRARLFHFESKSRGVDDTPAKVARALREVETIRTRWPEWSERDPYYSPHLTRDAEDFEIRL